MGAGIVLVSIAALLATGFGLSLFKKKSPSATNASYTPNTSPLTTNLGGIGSTTPVHMFSTPTQRKRKTRKLNKSRK